MKILAISPYFPRPSSGACTRAYHLLKALASRYEVSLIVLVDGSPDPDADAALAELKLQQIRKIAFPRVFRRKRMHQLLSVCRGKSRLLDAYQIAGVQRAIDEMVAHQTFDVVLFESVYMAGYRLPKGTQVIIDQHNIEHELLYRMFERERSLARKWYSWWESRQVKAVELARCRGAQGVLVTSRREASILKPHVPHGTIAVVPNGVAVDAFQPAGQNGHASNMIIFTGAMDYYPNVDAVLHFARESWPLVRAKLPTATWQIVGRNPAPAVLALRKLPGVSVVGAVPDVKPYLTAAAVAIAPLRIGSGTRLKILEAFAMGKAVVSTGLGCEGLDVANGEHLVVADEPAEFAAAVVELMRDSERRKSLGTAGRRLAECEYSWSRCGRDVVAAVEKMAR